MLLLLWDEILQIYSVGCNLYFQAYTICCTIFYFDFLIRCPIQSNAVWHIYIYFQYWFPSLEVGMLMINHSMIYHS